MSKTIVDHIDEVRELALFMSGPDKMVLARMITFFSVPTPGLKAKYLHPRELKAFWDSLSQGEKNDYWDELVFPRKI